MSESGKSLNQLLGEASAAKTFSNMQKLCNQSEYTIAGETYKRIVLKPKQLTELNILQKELETEDLDPEKRMENIKKQAFICLDGLTEEKWNETDAARMEIVVGACILISKGFLEV